MKYALYKSLKNLPFYTYLKFPYVLLREAKASFKRAQELNFTQGRLKTFPCPPSTSNPNVFTFDHQTQPREGIAKILDRLKIKVLALLGDEPFLAPLRSYLHIHRPEIRFGRPEDLPPQNGILILATEDKSPAFVRRCRSLLPDQYLILPSTGESSFRFQEPTKPVVFLAYSNAGTNRLLPQLELIFRKLHWNIDCFDPFAGNCNFSLKLMKAKNHSETELKEVSDYYRFYVQNLDRTTVYLAHRWVSPEIFLDLDVKLIVLIRDPRDLITSACKWKKFLDVDKTISDEERILKMLDGYSELSFHEIGLQSYWPSIHQMLDFFELAVSHPKVHLVRFEDLHFSDELTVKNLIHSLGLLPNPLFPVSEENFHQAAELASFKVQTTHFFRRGSQNEDFRFACRKGIVGDWKNNFTPKVISRFKELAGDRLAKIGYPDW